MPMMTLSPGGASSKPSSILKKDKTPAVRSPGGVALVPEMQSSTESWFQKANNRGLSREDPDRDPNAILRGKTNFKECEQGTPAARRGHRSKETREILNKMNVGLQSDYKANLIHKLKVRYQTQIKSDVAKQIEQQVLLENIMNYRKRPSHFNPYVSGESYEPYYRSEKFN